MTFTIEFAESVLDDLRVLRKFEQKFVLDSIEKLLSIEPMTIKRNRKPLRPNDLASWELRVDKFRVFYDLDTQKQVVIVRAVGWKNTIVCILLVRSLNYENDRFIRRKNDVAEIAWHCC